VSVPATSPTRATSTSSSTKAVITGDLLGAGASP
jgi:hypothetical protein